MSEGKKSQDLKGAANYLTVIRHELDTLHGLQAFDYEASGRVFQIDTRKANDALDDLVTHYFSDDSPTRTWGQELTELIEAEMRRPSYNPKLIAAVERLVADNADLRERMEELTWLAKIAKRYVHNPELSIVLSAFAPNQEEKEK